MRCPKCGTISFDWVKQCEKCGKELAEVARALGLDAESAETVNWFSLPEEAQDIAQAGEGTEMQAGAAGTDLSSIDVSDLIAPAASHGKDIDEEVPEIDADEVAKIAGDEVLSRTLDQVIQQEA